MKEAKYIAESEALKIYLVARASGLDIESSKEIAMIVYKKTHQ